MNYWLLYMFHLQNCAVNQVINSTFVFAHSYYYGCCSQDIHGK